MQAEAPVTADSTGFAARSLLWLQVLVVAVGALLFAFVPEAVRHPLLAAAALASLTISILLARSIPALERPLTRQHWWDLIALLASITMLAAASGGVGSSLMPLYAVPLAGVALAFGRWWLIIVFAAIVAACSFWLGASTPGINIAAPEFAVELLGVVAPGAAIALILVALIEQMHTAVQRISDLASKDAVTGLLNLRAFDEVLQQEHRKSDRFGRSYTLVVVDVDNLAQVNEALGHEAGSQILRAVAAAIARSIRNSDVAARLGGDEFIVLLVEADAATGASIAQRIRNNVFAGTVSVANRLVRANVSVGIANYPDDHLYPKELMILAEQRMQQDRELRRPPAA